jgi:predicted protein tyrosine phosphatase
MPSDKKRVLFVCTANQQRSPTAEQMYKDDPRFEVRSAGTSRLARTSVSAELLEWAEEVVVMEDRHAQEIRASFPEKLGGIRLHVLGIPDIYQFMNSRLQQELRTKVEQIFG